jgi:Tol biopolymer transport system component
MASVSFDHTAKLWRTSDWTVTRTITVPDSPRSVAFSSDGTLVAIGGNGNTQLNRVSDGVQVRVWPIESESVDFSPDGTALMQISSCDDVDGFCYSSIRMWSVANGSLLRRFTEELNGVTQVRISADGRYLAYGRQDGTVVLARNPFSPANPSAPMLGIMRTGSQAALSWPANQIGFTLESRTNLSAGGWFAITNWITVVGDQNTVAADLSTDQRFYRLRKPQ